MESSSVSLGPEMLIVVMRVPALVPESHYPGIVPHELCEAVGCSYCFDHAGLLVLFGFANAMVA